MSAPLMNVDNDLYKYIQSLQNKIIANLFMLKVALILNFCFYFQPLTDHSKNLDANIDKVTGWSKKLNKGNAIRTEGAYFLFHYTFSH